MDCRWSNSTVKDWTPQFSGLLSCSRHFIKYIAVHYITCCNYNANCLRVYQPNEWSIQWAEEKALWTSRHGLSRLWDTIHSRNRCFINCNWIHTGWKTWEWEGTPNSVFQQKKYCRTKPYSLVRTKLWLLCSHWRNFATTHWLVKNSHWLPIINLCGLLLIRRMCTCLLWHALTWLLRTALSKNLPEQKG